MKKILLLLFILSILFLFSCSQATESTIEGIWRVTHITGIPVAGNYYKFSSDGKYNEANTKEAVDKPTYSYKYTLSNGKLELHGTSIFTYDAYISGSTMYWYITNIEAYRLSKE